MSALANRVDILVLVALVAVIAALTWRWLRMRDAGRGSASGFAPANLAKLGVDPAPPEPSRGSDRDMPGPFPPAAGDQPCEESIYPEVESRLEHAFVQYSESRISASAYRKLVLSEEASVKEQVGEWQALVEAGGLSRPRYETRLNDAKDALNAIHWCLDWSERQIAADSGKPG